MPNRVNLTMLELADRIQRAKRNTPLHRSVGRSHGAVKHVFSHPDNPKGVAAKVARLVALEDMRHIDRNSPGHTGGFKSYARHAR